MKKNRNKSPYNQNFIARLKNHNDYNQIGMVGSPLYRMLGFNTYQVQKQYGCNHTCSPSQHQPPSSGAACLCVLKSLGEKKNNHIYYDKIMFNIRNSKKGSITIIAHY